MDGPIPANRFADSRHSPDSRESLQGSRTEPLFCESRFGGLNIFLRNDSRIDPRGSPRLALRIAGPSKAVQNCSLDMLRSLPPLHKISGPTGAFLSSAGLAFGTPIQRAQFLPVPALDKNQPPIIENRGGEAKELRFGQGMSAENSILRVLRRPQDRRYLGGPPVCLESLGKCQLPFLWSGLLVKRRVREVV